MQIDIEQFKESYMKNKINKNQDKSEVYNEICLTYVY